MHGPVVPSVYHELKQFGDGQFVLNDSNGDKQSSFGLDDEDATFAGEVWETYRDYSAWKLREMTHREEPWLSARRGHGPADKCHAEITQEAIREYFPKKGDLES